MTYFKLAIVGTSRLSEVEEMDARKRIALGIKNVMASLDGSGMSLQVITGDAMGIDKIAAQTANGLDIPVKAYVAEVKSWAGANGFKVRNEHIANQCHGIICVTTQIKDEECYHCPGGGHQRTGGCWTMQLAKSLGKETKLVII